MNLAGQLPEDGFVREQQIVGNRRKGIIGVLPISRSTWWAGVKSGLYPQPVKLGPRTTGWRVKDIRALIEKMGA